MKKTFKFIILLIIIIALLGMQNKVEAANVNFKPNSSEVNVGDTITVTATVTAAQWDLKITLNGTTLATSSELDNYESNITKTITANYKATQEGNLNFILEGDITDVNQKVDKVNTTVAVKVNKVETPPTTQDPQKPIDPKPVEPKFTNVNETVYINGNGVNVRESYSTSSKSIGILNKGTSLTRTGKGDNGWSRVIYNGKIAYISSSLLTTTKPAEEKPQVETPVQEQPTTEEPKQEDPTETNEDGPIDITNGLKSLEIAGLTLTPEFTPNVYEYRVIVEEDISALDINAVALTEDGKISIAGNENLKEGENLITITVYNSINEVATYQITTFKNTADLTKTDEMLKAGNKAATRGVIIFAVILAVSVIGLIVVLILKHRNEYEEYDEEDEDYDFGAYPDTPMPQNTNQYINQDMNYNVDDITNESIDDDINQNLDDTNNMEHPIQRSVMQEDFMQDDFTQENVAEQDTDENNALEGDIFEEEDKPKREKRKGKHF